MAIITCPECGQKISSTAQQCVHCGCKITVCSECGKVLLGEPDVCSECGFPFKKVEQKIQTPEKKQDFNDVAEAVKKWKEESVIAKILPYNTILACLLFALMFLGLVLVFINYSIPIDGNYENMVYSYKSSLSGIRGGIILFTTICIIVEIYHAYGGHIFCYFFWKWAKEKNIDLKKLIEKSFDIDYNLKPFKERQRYCVTLFLAVKTKLFEDNQLVREKTIKVFVVAELVNLIKEILFGVLLYTFLEYLLQSAIFNLTKDFDVFKTIINYPKLWAFLIPVALTIVELVIASYDKTHKEVELWVNKNMPNNYNKIVELRKNINKKSLRAE